MKYRLPAFGIAAFCLAYLAHSAVKPAQIRFAEVAGGAGLNFTLRNAAAGQFHQIELTGGGVAVFDYNNDGCMDVFFANGAAIPALKKTGAEFYNRLFRNNCDLTFTDVTEEAGLRGEGYSMAVASADFDNDGFADLYVTGVRGNMLYRNLGNGRFADVTARAGVGGGMWSVSAGWLDYDNDGLLDLFVSNYVVWEADKEPRCGSPEQQFYCHPREYKGLPDQLFHNNGDGTFTDVSQSSGIARHTGKGMGVAFADMDGDGLTDIFVANDSVRSFLFHNLGGGKFEEIGLESGVALRDDGYAIAGMGADFRDFDNDGKPDLVISGIINDSFQRFEIRAGAVGLRIMASARGCCWRRASSPAGASVCTTSITTDGRICSSDFRTWRNWNGIWGAIPRCRTGFSGTWTGKGLKMLQRAPERLFRKLRCIAGSPLPILIMTDAWMRW